MVERRGVGPRATGTQSPERQPLRAPLSILQVLVEMARACILLTTWRGCAKMRMD